MARRKRGHREDDSWRREQRTNAVWNRKTKPGDPVHRNEVPSRAPRQGRTLTGVEGPVPLKPGKQGSTHPGHRAGGKSFLGTSKHHHPYDPPGYHATDRGPAKARHGMSTPQEGG